MDDPAVQAASQAAWADLEREPDRGVSEGPDPVLVEVLTGSVWRELAAARDERERAGLRYVEAIRAARVAGFSWGEIARVLGESRQSLHRRFGERGSGRNAAPRLD